MNHRQVFKNVCNFIDGELDEATCQELKRHITACPRCRVYVDTLRKTIVLYKDKETPKKLSTSTRKRLYASIPLKLKKKK